MGKELRNNKELASYNAGLQTKENQRQEEWNASEWSRQFQMQEDQWQQHFQQETDWNSQQAQANRLREVGVNPIHALSGTPSNVTTSGSNSPSVSPRSGVSPSPAPFGESNIMPSLLNSLNDSVKTLMEGRLQDSEKRRIDSLLGGEVRSQLLGIENQQLSNSMQSMSNILFSKTMDISVQKAAADLWNTLTNSVLNQSQSDFYDASSYERWTQGLLNDFIKKHGEKMEPWQLAELKTNVLFLPRMLSSIADKNYADASASRASAREKTASAVNLEFMNDINNKTKDGILSKFWDSVQQAFNENQISGYQRDVANYTSQIMRYTNDQKELTFWKDFATDIVKSGTDIVNAVANVKSMGAWQGMSEASQKRVDGELEEMKRRYGARYELDREFKNGKWTTTRARMSTSSKDQFDSSLNR